MKKCTVIYAIVCAIATLIFLPCSQTFAQGKATSDDVYQLILRAVPVMEELGDAGLEAFKDPKGEFVYKDTYVLVLDCDKMVLAAHPNNKLIGIDLKDHLDKNPDPGKRKNQDREVCEVSTRANGGWVEYYWEKLGSDVPSRKISFTVRVPNTGYALVSGIYDDTTSVEELNARLK